MRAGGDGRRLGVHARRMARHAAPGPPPDVVSVAWTSVGSAAADRRVPGRLERPSGACRRPASRRAARRGRATRRRPRRRAALRASRRVPEAAAGRPFSPPLGTWPSGVSMSMICGRNIGQHRQQLTDVDARPAGQPLDRVRSERRAELVRLDRLVGTGRLPRVDRVAEAAGPQLREQPVESARALDRLVEAADGRRRVARRASVHGVRRIVHRLPPVSPSATRPSRLSGIVQSHVRRRFKQPPPGQVELDRRDRDAPVDDGVEVGARHGQPGRRRPADPEVGDAARVEPLDELVLVDALAQARHLEAVALVGLDGRHVDVDQLARATGRARGCSGRRPSRPGRPA